MMMKQLEPAQLTEAATTRRNGCDVLGGGKSLQCGSVTWGARLVALDQSRLVR